MSLFDRMMEKNVKRAQGMQDGMLDRTVSRAKSMQKKMLDMQEEIYDENGEQIERLNKKRAELDAAGTKIHYQAAASGVKEVMSSDVADKTTKFCHECGTKIQKSAKFCSECGAKQN